MNKSKLAVTALLVLMSLSAAGCLFSFVYGQLQDLARQRRLETFRDFERQEKAAHALEKEYRDWLELPSNLQKFHRSQLLSLDEFAAFRRDLDAGLAANGLQPIQINFTFGSSRDSIRKVTAKFSLAGSYANLKRFIFAMEAKTKMYFFTDLQLSASAATVKGDFTLEVYLGE